MNGMIALRTIMFFILTSLTSAMVGLGLVVVLHPGDPDTKADMTITFWHCDLIFFSDRKESFFVRLWYS